MDREGPGVLWSGLPDARGLVSSLAPCASHSGIPALISKSHAFPVLSARGLLRACAIWGTVAIFVEFSHGGARPNSGGARPGAGRPRHSNNGLLVSDVMRWYCVRTDFNAERLADIEVRLAGFEVFNPSVWRPAEPMRRDRNGVVRPAKPDRVVSMFPRYFFSRFNVADPSWGQIEHLPGVDRLMGAAGGKGSPGIVADDAIELLLTMVEPNGCQYPFDGRHGYQHHTALEVGTAQRMLAGGLQGQEGICTWSDGRRAKLLLSILGRPVSVTVLQSLVEEATIKSRGIA